MFSLKRLVKFGTILFFIGIFALLALYVSMRSNLPSVEVLKDIEWQTPMQIFSAEGELISQFGEKKRIPLTLEQMPQDLINAILATEDDRFYLHFGVDPIGMGRAILGQLMGQNKGGASTITMQVARNFFLSPEVNYTRKLREIFLSFHIESLLTKDEILSLYMNKISLGHRSFGFGAAAQVYYGKDVNDLTLAQIAVLAGLPKAPSTINPIRSPRRAKDRRSVVLQRMLVSGYISEEQYKEANSAPITGKRHGAEITLDAPYIAEMAHQEMIDMFGREQAYTGGYKVYTTIPAKLQRAAQDAVKTNLISYDERHGYRGPVKQLRSNIASSLVDEEQITAKEEDPLSSAEIVESLKSVSTYHNLEAAVVTDVFEKSVTAVLVDESIITIPWQGMSWAREFINDKKQGVAPKVASEILSYGDVIYVTETEKGYRLGQLPDASSAMVSLSPDNGAIKAAVGGFSFKQSQFNRVTQAKRQVGSNIKPFVYSAALDNGFTLATLVNDAPINQWDRKSGVIWRPKNSPAKYDGPIRVRLALAQSKNVVAVRLFREVGNDNVINHLAQFGFDPNDLPRNESLALGSASLTPLEVATGYATFANGGFLIEPFLIDRIEDSFGNIVYQHKPKWACEPCSQEYIDSLQFNSADANETSFELDTDDTSADEVTTPIIEQTLPAQESIFAAPRVISAQNAFLITEALNSAIWGADWRFKPFWQGTGWRARTLKRRDIAGKTGTTNQAKDAWFSGFSRRLVTTAWIGFDNPSRDLGKTVYNANLDKNQRTGGEAGAKSAQPAWISYMQSALVDLPIEPFEQPDNILNVRIDKATGKLTDKTNNSSKFEYFEVGTAPKSFIEEDSSSEILDGKSTEEDIF